MRLGLESFSTRHSGLDPVGVLRLASELGLAGVLLELSPFRSFRAEELARIRQTAQALGLYLEFGMGSIVHEHPMAQRGRQLLAEAGYDTSVSEAQTVCDHLRIAQALGSPLLRCVVGNLFSRDEGYDMTALADRTVAILVEACHTAEELGLKLALENHADFTVRELTSIAARVNSPALGFTIDVANLAFDLDDPLRLLEILGPRGLTVHYKDYRILRTPEGLALANVALGDGDLDLVALTERLVHHNPEIHLNIEVHSQYAPFRLDILRPSYWQRHPAPPGDGLAWYLTRAWWRTMPSPWPHDLPDGEPAWQRESHDLRRSIAWARQRLAHLR